MRHRIGLFAVVLLSLVPATAFAGGWAQPEGHGYAKVWGTALFGNSAFDLKGDALETDAFSIGTLSGYGEYGLRPDLTLVALLQPLGVASIGDQRRAFMGKMLIGFRQRFVSSDPFQLAIEARAGGSPGFGGERDLAPQSDAYDFRPTVRTWLAEWELQLGVGLGVGWISAALGPRWSSNTDLAPVIQGNAQIGFGPFAGFVLDAHLSLNHTLTAPQVVNPAGAGDTRYLGIGLGASYGFTPSFAISLAVDSALYARSNAMSPALQLGVEFRR